MVQPYKIHTKRPHKRDPHERFYPVKNSVVKVKGSIIHRDQYFAILASINK